MIGKHFIRALALFWAAVLIFFAYALTPVAAQDPEAEENPLNTFGRVRFTFEDGSTIHHSGGTVNTVFTFNTSDNASGAYYYRFVVYLHGSDGTELKATGFLDNYYVHYPADYRSYKSVRIPVDTEAFSVPAELVTLKCNFQIEKVLREEFSETGYDEVVGRSDIRECGMELRFGEPCETFEDIDRGSWYHAGIDFVSSMGMMRGVSENSFAPDSLMTRAMLVTVLWRKQGMPETGWSPFSDVPEDAYYAKAIAWAYSEGIIRGYNKTHFGPDDPITREQIATIILGYVSKDNTWFRTSTKRSVTEQTGERNALLRGSWYLSQRFDDADQISEYAVRAMEVLYENGILKGVSERMLDPQGFATRAQVATILQRYETYYIVFRYGF